MGIGDACLHRGPPALQIGRLVAQVAAKAEHDTKVITFQGVRARARFSTPSLFPELPSAFPAAVKRDLHHPLGPDTLVRRIEGEHLVEPTDQRVTDAQEMLRGDPFPLRGARGVGAADGVRAVAAVIGVAPRLQFAAEQTHQRRLLGGEIRHLVAIQSFFQAQTISDDGVNEAGDFFTHVSSLRVSLGSTSSQGFSSWTT